MRMCVYKNLFNIFLQREKKEEKVKVAESESESESSGEEEDDEEEEPVQVNICSIYSITQKINLSKGHQMMTF